MSDILLQEEGVAYRGRALVEVQTVFEDETMTPAHGVAMQPALFLPQPVIRRANVCFAFLLSLTTFLAFVCVLLLVPAMPQIVFSETCTFARFRILVRISPAHMERQNQREN